jgi:hypothetical protein
MHQMSKGVKKNAKDIYKLKEDVATIERIVQILKPLKTVTTLFLQKTFIYTPSQKC